MQAGGDERDLRFILLVTCFNKTYEFSLCDGFFGGEESYIFPSTGHEALRDVAGHGFPCAIGPGRCAPCNRRQNGNPFILNFSAPSYFFLYSLDMSPAEGLDLTAELEILSDFIIVQYTKAIDNGQWGTGPFDYFIRIEL